MPNFVSYSAVPLALTPFWVGLTSLFVTGIILVAIPARRHALRIALSLAGFVLAAGSAVAIAQNGRAVRSMDFNPVALTTDSIVGFWHNYHGRTLELRADSTRRCSHVAIGSSPCERAYARSRWSRSGVTTIVFDGPDTLTFRIVRFDGRLHLLGHETWRRGKGKYPVLDLQITR